MAEYHVGCGAFGKCKFAICSAVPCSRCDWWQQEYVEPYKTKE